MNPQITPYSEWVAEFERCYDEDIYIDMEGNECRLFIDSNGDEYHADFTDWLGITRRSLVRWCEVTGQSKFRTLRQFCREFGVGLNQWRQA